MTAKAWLPGDADDAEEGAAVVAVALWNAGWLRGDWCRRWLVAVTDIAPRLFATLVAVPVE